MTPFRNQKRRIVVSALLVAVTLALGSIAYVSFFQKDGLDHLPAKPCHGAISRETIQKTLKDTESVDLRTFQTEPDSSFKALCDVFAEDGSGFYTEAKIADSGVSGWRDWENSQAGDAGKPTIEYAAGDKAISWPRRSSLYMKCSPRLKKYRPVEQYALVVETRIRGSMRINGEELRQRLANITIQMAHYAQKIVKCEEKTSLPPPTEHPVPL